MAASQHQQRSSRRRRVKVIGAVMFGSGADVTWLAAEKGCCGNTVMACIVKAACKSIVCGIYCRRDYVAMKAEEAVAWLSGVGAVA